MGTPPPSSSRASLVLIINGFRDGHMRFFFVVLVLVQRLLRGVCHIVSLVGSKNSCCMVTSSTEVGIVERGRGRGNNYVAYRRHEAINLASLLSRGSTPRFLRTRLAITKPEAP